MGTPLSYRLTRCYFSTRPALRTLPSRRRYRRPDGPLYVDSVADLYESARVYLGLPNAHATAGLDYYALEAEDAMLVDILVISRIVDAHTIDHNVWPRAINHGNVRCHCSC